jgi:hypothetical protein
MRISFRTRVFSSSRGSHGEQGLGFEKPAQIKQGGDGNAWAGFFAQETAGAGIEHPSRNGQGRAISELDDVTLFGQAPRPPHAVALMIEKGMMPVVNLHRRQ